ncbi:MAG: HEAT repeat domain-containing protein [Armatimonadota bacterium]|nr:HEAT repeat domain-containing protein [Armatimonadota bacterium]
MSTVRDEVTGVDSNSEGIECLIEIVTQHEDPKARLNAAYQLAETKGQRASSVFLGLLIDPNREMRYCAALSLRKFPGASSVQALIQCVTTDADSDARKVAAYSLGCLRARRGIVPLIQVMLNAEEEPEVRGQAAEALGMIRSRRGVSPLRKALSDPVIDVRYWAAFALGQIGDPSAIPDLERLAAEDKAVLDRWGSVRDEALGALQNLVGG